MSNQRKNLLDESALPGEFAVYDHFLRVEDMNDTAYLLEEGGILVRRSTEAIGQWREKVIVGTALQPEFYLEIPEHEFARARYLIREAAEEAWAAGRVKGHPFNDYHNEELLAILEREETHGIESAVVARNLLLLRGVDLELQPIRDKFRERQHGLAAAKELPGWRLLATTIIGVASALVFQPILLLVGAGLLWHYHRGVVRSINGRPHYRYGARTRVRSKWMLALVAIALTFGLTNALFGHWIELSPVRTWWWLWR